MKVIIYGTGRHAELTHYLLTHDTEHEVVAFCVDEVFYGKSEPLFGLPLVKTDDLRTLFPPCSYSLHIAIGNNAGRAHAFEITKSWGYSFVSYLCSMSQRWPDLKVGENVFMDQGSGAHPFVSIGDNTILITTRIGHHSSIGSNVLCSCSDIGGSVTIGDGSYLGMNSVIRDGVRIGKNNMIGAGCYITEDTEDFAVYSAPRSVKRAMSSDRVAFFNKVSVMRG